MRPSASLLLLPLFYAGIDAQSSGSSSSPAPANGTVSLPGSVGSIVGNATSVTSTSSSAGAASTIVNNGENPFIPITISSACQTTLETINGDTAIAACVSPLLASLSAFLPSAATSFTQTSADVSTTLQNLCSSDVCSTSLIQTTLSQISKSCSAELQARNDEVLPLYDTLYVFAPFLAAVCSTDSAGKSCLLGIVSGNVSSTVPTSLNSTSTSNSTSSNNTTSSTPVLATTSFDIQQYIQNSAFLNSPQALFHSVTAATTRLLRRQSSGNSTTTNTTTNSTNSTTVFTPASANSPVTLSGLVPTAAPWSSTNLNFMFLNVTMPSGLLCTSCTKDIFAAYITQEMAVPYALGLASSPLLGQQSVVWAGLGVTCGSGFLQSIATTAGETVVSTGAASSVMSQNKVGTVVMALLVGTIGILIF